jgi:membrane protease YdiL (CAAX protease family)
VATKSAVTRGHRPVSSARQPSRRAAPAWETGTAPTAEIGFGSLGAFVALAFGLGWGVVALLLLFTDRIESVFGPVSGTNPVFVLAVYSPAIAGVLVVWWHRGWKGLGSYLRRLTLWRMPAAWWAFLVVGIPAVVYASAALKGPIANPFTFAPWQAALPALAAALAIGPVEELGWRGVALPLLQRRLAPVWAGLVLGAVWGLWHAPAFVLGGTPQSAWSFGPYVVGVVALSVVVTPMFNASRGSILIPALFHFQMNNPIWPDAQPWDTLAWAIVAAAVVLLNRRAMLARDGAATDVLTPNALVAAFEV